MFVKWNRTFILDRDRIYSWANGEYPPMHVRGKQVSVEKLARAICFPVSYGNQHLSMYDPVHVPGLDSVCDKRGNPRYSFAHTLALKNECSALFGAHEIEQEECRWGYKAPHLFRRLLDLAASKLLLAPEHENRTPLVLSDLLDVLSERDKQRRAEKQKDRQPGTHESDTLAASAGGRAVDPGRDTGGDDDEPEYVFPGGVSVVCGAMILDSRGDPWILAVQDPRAERPGGRRPPIAQQWTLGPVRVLLEPGCTVVDICGAQGLNLFLDGRGRVWTPGGPIVGLETHRATGDGATPTIQAIVFDDLHPASLAPRTFRRLYPSDGRYLIARDEHDRFFGYGSLGYGQLGIRPLGTTQDRRFYCRQGLLIPLYDDERDDETFDQPQDANYKLPSVSEWLDLPFAPVQISCGEFHVLMLDPGGQIWSRGRNSHGELGRTIAPGQETLAFDDYGEVLCSHLLQPLLYGICDDNDDDENIRHCGPGCRVHPPHPGVPLDSAPAAAAAAEAEAEAEAEEAAAATELTGAATGAPVAAGTTRVAPDSQQSGTREAEQKEEETSLGNGRRAVVQRNVYSLGDISAPKNRDEAYERYEADKHDWQHTLQCNQRIVRLPRFVQCVAGSVYNDGDGEFSRACSFAQDEHGFVWRWACCEEIKDTPCVADIPLFPAPDGNLVDLRYLPRRMQLNFAIPTRAHGCTKSAKAPPPQSPTPDAVSDRLDPFLAAAAAGAAEEIVRHSCPSSRASLKRPIPVVAAAVGDLDPESPKCESQPLDIFERAPRVCLDSPPQAKRRRTTTTTAMISK